MGTFRNDLFGKKIHLMYSHTKYLKTDLTLYFNEDFYCSLFCIYFKILQKF